MSYGEIQADGLSEAVTVNFGSFIANNNAYLEVRLWAQGKIRDLLNSTCQRELNLARARLQQEINRQLEKLPEHRRRFAELAIQRILLKLYNEPEDRVRPIISVVLDAVERDEYRVILEKVYEASRSDVSAFADALSEGAVAHGAHGGVVIERNAISVGASGDQCRAPSTSEASGSWRPFVVYRRGSDTLACHIFRIIILSRTLPSNRHRRAC